MSPLICFGTGLSASLSIIPVTGRQWVFFSKERQGVPGPGLCADAASNSVRLFVGNEMTTARLQATEAGVDAKIADCGSLFGLRRGDGPRTASCIVAAADQRPADGREGYAQHVGGVAFESDLASPSSKAKRVTLEGHSATCCA